MCVIQVSYRGVDRDTRMKPNTEYKKKNNNNVTCYTEQLYRSTGFLLLSMDTAETEMKARDWCSYRGLPILSLKLPFYCTCYLMLQNLLTIGVLKR